MRSVTKRAQADVLNTQAVEENIIFGEAVRIKYSPERMNREFLKYAIGYPELMKWGVKPNRLIVSAPESCRAEIGRLPKYDHIKYEFFPDSREHKHLPEPSTDKKLLAKLEKYITHNPDYSHLTFKKIKRRGRPLELWPKGTSQELFRILTEAYINNPDPWMSSSAINELLRRQKKKMSEVLKTIDDWEKAIEWYEPKSLYRLRLPPKEKL